MGKTYKIQENKLQEIQEARKNTKNKNEDKRLNAIKLRAKGLKSKEIAKKLDIRVETLSRWTVKYNKEGIKGLLNKKKVRNRRNLSIEQEKEFLSKFEEKANKGQIITVKEIEKEYKELVGHEIGSGQIYKVLKRHGFRKVMPRSKHPKKARQEAIKASKKLKV